MPIVVISANSAINLVVICIDFGSRHSGDGEGICWMRSIGENSPHVYTVDRVAGQGMACIRQDPPPDDRYESRGRIAIIINGVYRAESKRRIIDGDFAFKVHSQARQ